MIVYKLREDGTFDYTNTIVCKPNEVPEGYAIDDTTDHVKADGTRPTDTELLEQARIQKIKELSNTCQHEIIYGFTASNGNSYRLTIEDQLNMQGMKSELDDDSTITEVEWMTIEDELVIHSRDEWLTVYSDAFNHKNTCIFKNKSLRDQARSATTLAELESIQWG